MATTDDIEALINQELGIIGWRKSLNQRPAAAVFHRTSEPGFLRRADRGRSRHNCFHGFPGNFREAGKPLYASLNFQEHESAHFTPMRLSLLK
jgi:hypothetical protein